MRKIDKIKGGGLPAPISLWSLKVMVAIDLQVIFVVQTRLVMQLSAGRICQRPATVPQWYPLINQHHNPIL